ncbi:MAG: glycosyltransferase [Candidatus Paceibacterota bacterium]
MNKQLNRLDNSDTITVIVPIFNVQQYLEEFLQALLDQNYPKGLIQTIIIDNGSTDQSVEIAKNYPIKLLFENAIRSPYAARNRGLEVATGKYIALIDANKIPHKDWLIEGITAIKDQKADLLGGDIQFSLPDPPTASNLYDSFTFNNNHTLVTTENGSAAGNLFFHRSLTDEIGMFPENFRSGMDIWWTQKAVRSGYKLRYSEKAVVYCKPRNFKEIISKSYRVGKIHPFNQRQNGVSLPSVVSNTFKTFAPPKISRYKKYRSDTKSHILSIKIWFVAWLSKIFMGMGRINGLFKMSNHSF